MQKRIKIVILIDTWFPVIGGGQTHVFNLASYLKRYCEISILTSNQKGKIPSEFKLNVELIRLGPPLSTNNPFRKLIFLFYSFWYLIGSDFDVIHAQAFISGVPAKIASIIKKKPVIYTVHGTGLVNGLIYKGFWGESKKFLEIFLLLKIKYDAQISVSRDFLSLKNNNKPIYIPNGKTLAGTNTSKKINNSILFVGRIHPQKGIDVLLKAFVRSRKAIEGLKLTIVGIGDVEKLKKTLTKLNLKNCVMLEKPVYGKELLRVIQNHEIFILPSVYEGQPITLIEALAVKTPIIASRVGDVPYLLKDSVSALLVSPNDWKGFSRAIVEVSSNQQLAKKLANNGYKVYLSHDTWQQVANKTYQIYQRVLKYET